MSKHSAARFRFKYLKNKCHHVTRSRVSDVSRRGRSHVTSFSLDVIEFPDLTEFLLAFHPSILEPDLDLSLSKVKAVGEFNAALASEVEIVLKLFLQFQRLLSAVRLSTSPPL